MKRHLPWIITTGAAALIAISLFRPTGQEEEKWRAFGELPVLLNGRIKPLDTVARNSLLVLHNKQSLELEDETEPEKLTAIEWLAELCFDPRQADQRPLFPIHDPQVLSLFGWQQEEEHNFSFAQLRPKLAEVDRQARLADPVPPQDRSPFQRHIMELYNRLVMYQQLKSSLQDERAEDFATTISAYEKVLVPGVEAVRKHGTDLPADDPEMNALLSLGVGFQQLSERASLRVVPPRDPAAAELRTDWKNIGESLMASLADGSVHPVVKGYARLGAAYRADDDAAFITETARLEEWLAGDYQPELNKTSHETIFNRFAPFYVAMPIYVSVFVLASLSWLTGPGVVRRTAFYLAGLAFLIHSAGIVYRVLLQGYAPVTNLYSSAVFVGWAAVLLGLALEALFRIGIGSAVSGVIGFVTLLIAHHLSHAGDTMEMMQAVLDNNFWLSTHVITITIGYSATFLAGALAIVYIVMGVFGRWLQYPFSLKSAAAVSGEAGKSKGETNSRALYRMVYGIICFATLFSFIGTVLGGIWADQSWGRFWGWDPKENGAALLVLWNAIILHARWGGYVRERGVMVMAVFGNVVTAGSWFGVNLLSVGLHSYGFTESGAQWLGLFWLSQLAIMGIGLTPLHLWKSFSSQPPKSPPPPAGSGGQPSPIGGAAGR